MNILVSIKRFFTNKNVVTVIGVILIIGLLYWGYNKAIEKEKTIEASQSEKTNC